MTPPSRPDPRDADGFTLIELMIALGLFALIAIAGLALVDSVIGVQRKTEVRLDRLATLQRAMFVIASDLDQIARGRVSGGGGTIQFVRSAPGFGGPPVDMRYSIAAGTLIRSAGPLPQVVLPGVTGAQWRFFDKGQWFDRWPATDDDADRWPQAVEVTMQVATPGGLSGSLRRVVALPAKAQGDDKK